MYRPRGGRTAQLHESGARPRGLGRCARSHSNPGPHRPALRCGHERGLLSGTGPSPARPEPGGGIRLPRRPDRRGHDPLRAGGPGARARLGPGLRRCELHPGRGPGLRQAARARGARGGRGPLIRPHHARGDQPALHGPGLGPPLHPHGGRKQEPGP